MPEGVSFDVLARLFAQTGVGLDHAVTALIATQVRTPEQARTVRANLDAIIGGDEDLRSRMEMAYRLLRVLGASAPSENSLSARRLGTESPHRVSLPSAVVTDDEKVVLLTASGILGDIQGQLAGSPNHLALSSQIQLVLDYLKTASEGRLNVIDLHFLDTDVFDTLMKLDEHLTDPTHGMALMRAHYVLLKLSMVRPDSQHEVSFGVPADALHHSTFNIRQDRRWNSIQASDIPVAYRRPFFDTVNEGIRTVRISFPFVRSASVEHPISDIVMFRCQHNNARGQHKGGIRWIQTEGEVDIEKIAREEVGSVVVLATGMTDKTAALGIPYGGGKGGVIAPKDLSLGEQIRLFFMLGYFLADDVGPLKDIPAPDMDTRGYHMNAFRAGFEARHGVSAPGVVTGKTVDNDGLEGRDEATALGGFYIADRILTHDRGLSWSDINVVVEGYGNAGQHAARLANEVGARVIAISDSRSMLFNPDGISQERLSYHAAQKLAAERHGEKYYLNAMPEDLAAGSHLASNREVWRQKATVIFAAAKEETVGEEQVEMIHSLYGEGDDPRFNPILIELANDPTTAQADELINQRRVVTAVPDSLANSGGVGVSYFEWQRAFGLGPKNRAEVREALKAIILTAYLKIKRIAEKKGVSLRGAALIKAQEEVYAAMAHQIGWPAIIREGAELQEVHFFIANQAQSQESSHATGVDKPSGLPLNVRWESAGRLLSLLEQKYASRYDERRVTIEALRSFIGDRVRQERQQTILAQFPGNLTWNQVHHIIEAVLAELAHVRVTDPNSPLLVTRSAPTSAPSSASSGDAPSGSVGSTSMGGAAEVAEVVSTGEDGPRAQSALRIADQGGDSIYATEGATALKIMDGPVLTQAPVPLHIVSHSDDGVDVVEAGALHQIESGAGARARNVPVRGAMLRHGLLIR